MNVMKRFAKKACELRDKSELNNIDKRRPGYYKWWADREHLETILNKLNLTFNEVCSDIEEANFEGRKWYCVYIGIAVKESVKARLNWHINQKHTYNQVKNGMLSTLRKTIASIVGVNMLDKEATNIFIDSLMVEFFLSENEIHSDSASIELHNI